MQKNSRHASILIWSIFLSLIMSISFISISTKINKTIHNNQNVQENIDTYISTINNNGNELSSEKYFLQTEDLHTFYYSFKKNESLTLSLSGSSQQLVGIEILSGGPIEFVFNGNKEFLDTNTAFSGTLNDAQLQINNLSGYSFVKIKTSAEIQKPFQRYIQGVKIGNQNVIQQYGTFNNN